MKVWQVTWKKFSWGSRRRLSSRTTRRGAFCKCILLLGLTVSPIGCAEKSEDRFAFPDNPTPLPDPSTRIESDKKAAPMTIETINQR